MWFSLTTEMAECFFFFCDECVCVYKMGVLYSNLVPTPTSQVAGVKFFVHSRVSVALVLSQV